MTTKYEIRSWERDNLRWNWVRPQKNSFPPANGPQSGLQIPPRVTNQGYKSQPGLQIRVTNQGYKSQH